MASLNSESGNRRIQFTANGKRKTLRLGKLSKRQCETVKSYVERLVASATSGDAIDPDTRQWLRRITTELHDKLANVGLVQHMSRAPLGQFIDEFIEGRVDLKAATVKQLRQTQANLVSFFGASCPLSKITKADAEDWARWLTDHEGLGENTKARRVGRARQFFNRALKQGVIYQNPMHGIKCTVGSDESRFHFVSMADYEKLLDAAPDAQWRAIIALSRIGGLRCPSEILALRWDHVLWDQDRLVVPTPKLAHIDGRASRVAPLFPELRRGLNELWDQTAPGTAYVINRYRDASQNLRTTFSKIVRRAGLEPWGKPFQNMRASRSTELEDQFPTHVAAKWLGHSPKVARKHYHMVHDEHFERAIRLGDATQKATYATHAHDGMASHDVPGQERNDCPKPKDCKDLRGGAAVGAKKKPGFAGLSSAEERTRTSTSVKLTRS